MGRSAKIVCLLAMLHLLVVPAAGAEPPEKPWRDITTEELADLLDEGAKLTLANVLPKIIYDAKHLPGSVNIPLGKVGTSERMPVDKDRLLVFYCMGTL